LRCHLCQSAAFWQRSIAGATLLKLRRSVTELVQACRVSQLRLRVGKRTCAGTRCATASLTGQSQRDGTAAQPPTSKKELISSTSGRHCRLIASRRSNLPERHTILAETLRQPLACSNRSQLRKTGSEHLGSAVADASAGLSIMQRAAEQATLVRSSLRPRKCQHGLHTPCLEEWRKKCSRAGAEVEGVRARDPPACRRLEGLRQ